jgi:pSer/pThr/pTyr-binding forkhead associated (FHA) protein
MGFLDKFEKGVEGAVNGVFSKIGVHDLKPVDLIVALRGEVDSSVLDVKNGRKVAPNVFVITLSTPDFDKVELWGTADFANELVEAVRDHEDAEGYSRLGDITVTFVENVENSKGQYQIASEATLKGTSPKATDIPDILADQGQIGRSQTHYSGQVPNISQAGPPVISTNVLPNSEDDVDDLESEYPSIVTEGVRYYLNNPITVLGRGSNCDITINDSAASRRHLELRVTPTGVLATDLQSANGIWVDGNKTKFITLRNGNTITLGKTILTFYDAFPKEPEPTPDETMTQIVDRSFLEDNGLVDSTNDPLPAQEFVETPVSESVANFNEQPNPETPANISEFGVSDEQIPPQEEPSFGDIFNNDPHIQISPSVPIPAVPSAPTNPALAGNSFFDDDDFAPELPKVAPAPSQPYSQPSAQMSSTAPATNLPNQPHHTPSVGSLGAAPAPASSQTSSQISSLASSLAPAPAQTQAPVSAPSATGSFNPPNPFDELGLSLPHSGLKSDTTQEDQPKKPFSLGSFTDFDNEGGAQK